MAGGRPTGVKNKFNHRAGGDRKSKVYQKKENERELKKSDFTQQLEEYKKKWFNISKENVKHFM